MHEGHDPHEEAHFDPETFDLSQPTEDVEGLESFSLTSVGIDIGSSTSHLVFSHLKLRREGAALSTRFDVTEREVLYRSRIMLTPYLSETLIDVEQLKTFIHDAYRLAGFAPSDIDTGAVVITGEALKKENARPITEFFAQDSGKFICASAGPNHEALLAAHGCGATALSQRERATVLNVDIGGGTSKLSLIRDGVVTQTAAINVGARLIAFDERGVLTRVEQPATRMMRELGYVVAVGDRVTQQQREELASLMASLLFEAMDRGPSSALARELMITEPLGEYRGLDQVDLVVFSGGVSEYIYDREATSYGDLGSLLGRGIREHLRQGSWDRLLREPPEGIRATVIGAGEYTIQASGTTSYISSARALPAFGLKVVKTLFKKERAVDADLRQALAKFDLDTLSGRLALAISIDEQPTYQSLRNVAEGIAAAVDGSDDDPSPLFLVMDMDVAKSLGGILKEELGLARELVAVDGIDVGDLDFIDIGRPMGISESLPVTVKSLMFPSER